MQKLITLLVFAMLALSLAGCHIVYTARRAARQSAR
jgi:hypothetical protein